MKAGPDGLLCADNLKQKHFLTDPEAQILRSLKAGKERSGIAADIGADEVAVKEHIRTILRRPLGCKASGFIR